MSSSGGNGSPGRPCGGYWRESRSAERAASSATSPGTRGACQSRTSRWRHGDELRKGPGWAAAPAFHWPCRPLRRRRPQPARRQARRQTPSRGRPGNAGRSRSTRRDGRCKEGRCGSLLRVAQHRRRPAQRRPGPDRGASLATALGKQMLPGFGWLVPRRRPRVRPEAGPLGCGRGRSTLRLRSSGQGRAGSRGLPGGPKSLAAGERTDPGTGEVLACERVEEAAGATVLTCPELEGPGLCKARPLSVNLERLLRTAPWRKRIDTQFVVVGASSDAGGGGHFADFNSYIHGYHWGQSFPTLVCTPGRLKC